MHLLFRHGRAHLTVDVAVTIDDALLTLPERPQYWPERWCSQMSSVSDEQRPAVRRYRSSLRRRQAEATRERVCRAAAPLFAERGYANTSVRRIAAAAGVAVETVYAIGGKAEVFLRSFELAFSGTLDGASLLELDALAPVRAAGSLHEFVEGITAFITESNQRSAGLWTAYVEAANADPVLAATYARRMQDMRADGRRVLDATVERGLYPAPADPEYVVDAIWVTLHPSQYVLLVTHAGWSHARYRAWMSAAVMGVLNGPSGPRDPAAGG